jgi:N-glycosylase/DNA lyase
MLQAIRKTYGQPLCPVPYRSISNFKKEEKDGQDNSRTSWIYSFPSLQHLHQTATEQDLRQSCGMGYRAKYLIQSMNQLMTLGGESYLYQLRQQQTKNENNNALNVQNQLIQFSGIGRKVADCIALFSLRQDDAIPVDTHVWNIALRDYANDEEDVASKESSPVVSLRMAKSLTPTVYQRVGDIFRKRFPNKSGWAHSLLFVAELPSFRNVLPPHIVQEMDRFRQEEKAKKQKTRSHPKS